MIGPLRRAGSRVTRFYELTIGDLKTHHFRKWFFGKILMVFFVFVGTSFPPVDSAPKAGSD